MKATKKELETYLQDTRAFIIWCMRHNKPAELIMSTVAHDIGGLLRSEPCFSPRVTGYTKIINEE
jgi:hypothetical protein